jgi:stage IV sporulation protein FB
VDRAGQAAVVAATNPGVWRFNLLGFPITVEPLFWLICFLLGGGIYARGRLGIILLLISTVVIFFSIMVHELGHAFAARKYGARPEIRLHGFGGVTIMHGGYFSRGQNIMVSAAGPLAGFCLAGLVWLIDRAFPITNDFGTWAVYWLLRVNIVWTVLNLLPILPLDGGQITRDLLGPRRIQITIWLGIICAVTVALYAFKVDQWFLGIMMFILAFSNFQSQGAQGGVVRD